MDSIFVLKSILYVLIFLSLYEIHTSIINLIIVFSKCMFLLPKSNLESIILGIEERLLKTKFPNQKCENLLIWRTAWRYFQE